MFINKINFFLFPLIIAGLFTSTSLIGSDEILRGIILTDKNIVPGDKKSHPHLESMINFDLRWMVISEEPLSENKIKIIYGNRANQTGVISGEINGTTSNASAEALLTIEENGDFNEEVTIKFTINTDDGATIDVVMDSAILIPAENVTPMYQNAALPHGYNGLAEYSAYATRFTTTAPQYKYLTSLLVISRDNGGVLTNEDADFIQFAGYKVIERVVFPYPENFDIRNNLLKSD